MPYQILICDDSKLARKQLARSLPDDLQSGLSFASHGLEAIEAIRSQRFDLLLLDLTMPVMDGYEVLETLKQEGHDIRVVVVSADIQQEALRRVKQLGAREFIRKPCDPDTLTTLLQSLEIYPASASAAAPSQAGAASQVAEPTADIDPLERISEVANVAMGRAASLLADLLEVFVVLPLPVVNVVEPSELQMAISAVGSSREVSAVSQGFVGSGISGEAFLMLHDTGIRNLAQLMNHQGPCSHEDRIEILMDVANILISACLKGFEEQLDIHFSQSHPTVLGQKESIEDLLERGRIHWQKTLAIEFDYRIEQHDIQCTLMLLFSEDGLARLHKRTSYLG